MNCMATKRKNGKLKKCMLFLMVLVMLNSPLMPFAELTGGQIGSMEAQASTVYKKLYFTGGISMLPSSRISSTLIYMKKNDIVQFAVSGKGTMKLGIERNSDGRKYGVTRTGTFSVALRVPSNGYYRVFFINPGMSIITFKGTVFCSR